MSTSRFVFKKQDKIGVADALADKNVLLKCFIETGDYEAVSAFERPERFILGRTGAGKTALVMRLSKEHENTIVIQPESLALSYVSNSTILKSVNEMGVDLDIFFRLLWRHVLGVEILKHHFNINNEEDNFSVMDRLRQRFTRGRKSHHLRALTYLEEWGSSFWKETDSRVKELTTTLEKGIEGTVGASSPTLISKLKGNKKITEEERAEVVHLAQSVVNGVQMRELTDLMKMLDDAIEDKQKKYYIIIDRLDENWVEDELRYRLIRALIETVNDFNVVEQIKPLIVLRTDLINRVYDVARSSGFQEEKFSSLNLPLRWTRSQLLEVLDARIDHLVKQRYTTKKVTHKDLLPEYITGIKTSDYILDRTLMRPRDIIQFFNLCIVEAVDEPVISEEMVIRAEREYSRDRLAAIYDEWYADYPQLRDFIKLVEGTQPEIFAEDIDNQQLENLCLNYAEESSNEFDKLGDLVNSYLDEKLSLISLKKELIRILYNVGVLGVKLEGHQEAIWSHELRRTLRVEEIHEDTILCLHPCFWSALRTGV